MINYLLKRENIKMNKSEIEAMINTTVRDLKIDRTKIDSMSLLEKSFDYQCKKMYNLISNSILKSDALAYIASPAIRKDIISNSVISAEIVVPYYPFEEIKKINYKNTPVNYIYNFFDENSIVAIFENTIKNCTFKNPVNDFIKQNDLVKLNIKLFQNNVLMKDDKNVLIIANRTNNFTINNAILNHWYGEIFSINDPLGRKWEMQVIEIKRTVSMPITNQNIHFLKIPYVTNLITLKNFFFSMTKKQNAIKEVMRYFDSLISELENTNTVIIPDEFINSKISDYTHQYLEKVNPNNRAAIEKSIQEKDQYGKQIIDNAINSAKREIVEGIVKKLVYTLEKIKVHDMEVNQELNLSENILFQSNNYYNRNENKNANTVKEDLINIKIALKLLQLNAPQLFLVIARDAAIAV